MTDITAFYRRMPWTNRKSESAVVACPACDNPHLRIIQTDSDTTSVSVVMRCDTCPRFVHLGIKQHPNEMSEPAFVVLDTS